MISNMIDMIDGTRQKPSILCEHQHRLTSMSNHGIMQCFILQDGAPLCGSPHPPWRSHTQTEDEDGSQT